MKKRINELSFIVFFSKINDLFIKVIMMKEIINEILIQYLCDEVNVYKYVEDIYCVLVNDRVNRCDKKSLENSDLAIVFYRVAQYLFWHMKKVDVANKVAEDGLKKTSIYISPKTIINDGLQFINAEHTRIGENIKIGKNLCVSGKVTLKSGECLKPNNSLEIGDNFIINNATVIGCNKIGSNVKIDSGCTVLDDVGDDCEVRIVSSLQMLISSKKNLLPSQKIFVYGVVPKFKNQIVVYGEGFYNPVVDIKIKNCTRKIESEVSYWDKNTIIIKVKPINLELEALKNNKIIIKSNGYKCVVNNSMGLAKILR